MNRENWHHYDLVKNTDEDGTLKELRITYWDIRFSNNCNMKCQSWDLTLVQWGMMIV